MNRGAKKKTQNENAFCYFSINVKSLILASNKTNIAMRFVSFFPFTILLLSLSAQTAHSQKFSLHVNIINQPDNPVILESVSGDNYKKLDSATVTNREVSFQFPVNAHTGVYRLIFGETGYARVMNSDPQMLDFIFNNENIDIKTDFDNPATSAVVVHSKENQVYFDFRKRLAEYQNALTLMEQELDSYWQKGDSAKANQLSNEFNMIQLEWDLKVAQTVQQNDDLYASKLIAFARTPQKDGFLSPAERKETFRDDFLESVDFTDESLIYSSVLTDKIFEYLVLFNREDYTQDQRTKVYIKAVDEILSHSKINPKINNFVTAYLIHGFEVLGMKKVTDHIRAKS